MIEMSRFGSAVGVHLPHLIALLLLGACSASPSERQDVHIGIVSQAVTQGYEKSEYDGTHWFTESAATAFINQSGVEEWVVDANSTNPRIEDPNNFLYACTTNQGQSWHTYSLGVPGNQGDDPSLVALPAPYGPGQQAQFYAASLLQSQSPQGVKAGYGIRILYMTEPCPTNGSFS